MRKIALLLAAAGIGFAGAASAADMAPMYKKAVAAPIVPWTGCYIGAYVGVDASRKVTTTNSIEGTVSYTPGAKAMGGYENGCNWQVSPNFVLGYEGETGYLQVKGTANFPGPSTFNTTVQTGALVSTWTGRAGYLVDPKLLLYVKGGVSWLRLDSGLNSAVIGIGSSHTNMWGYAVGAGGEYMIDNKWSVKLEYLYLGFDKDLTFVGNNGSTTTTHFAGIHTGKVGLNYKWDWFSLFR